MENWKAVLYMLAFGQGMLLSISLIVRGIKKERASIFLGIILFVLALEILNAWGIQVRYHKASYAIPFWNFQSYLLLPLSLWFFAKLTTERDYVFKKRYALLFAPILLELTIRSLWRTYARSTNRSLPSLLDIPVWFFFTEILPIIGMCIVLSVYGRKLFAFQSAWKGLGFALKSGDYFRLYGFFTFLLILTLLWIAGVVFKWPVFAGVEALLTICLFGLGYIGYLSPTFFNLPTLPKPKVAEKPDFLHYDDLAELKKLHAAFHQDSLHIQSKLTLEELASQLHLPPRYVSYLINTHCASNFNNFVNGFRVEEVIRKLGDPKEQHKTVLALAFEAGFNSKSTFNQVFRQHTGKSPSQYLLVQK
ncbi:helix-turn-helix domain-containing protein [Dyadobacter fanqingshengii]|uniref:AraC family transcriptional regulator n=1 Tax=Dyadobacter fanqingshengii TaxID=2906443 RepID=A0A9X1PB12_9BACT|nr:AraC family transcriptional regulator [Dyadobacter fanqingshengii]MCF0041275.1 AraC family transcriptional regulator [Dyadobacter fanqingshengii]USJ37000.1 AraC family transcriptional regulator [Dyadobacter fanqingshengii]